MLPVMRSIKCIVIISKEYSQPSILSMVLYIFLTLKNAVTQFCQRIFFQRILENRGKTSCQSSYIFRASSIILNEISYCFLIITFWCRILFLIGCFLNIITFLAKLLFRRSFFFRTSNYSDRVLFWSACFYSHFFW